MKLLNEHYVGQPQILFNLYLILSHPNTYIENVLNFFFYLSFKNVYVQVILTSSFSQFCHGNSIL